MAIGAIAQLRGPLAADPRDPRRFGTHVWWGPGGEVIEGWGVNDVPARCPYKIGDWVRLHGYPGYAGRGSERWLNGFRGVALGHHGSTLLSGLTDDGRPWTEHWGVLERDDGRHRCDTVWCTCCPHPERFVRRRPVERVEQLDLFGALT